MRINRSAAVLTALAFAGSAAMASPARAAKAPAPIEIPDVAPARLAGAPLMDDFGEYVNGPAVLGAQSCDPVNEAAPLPTARQDWMYYHPEDDTSGYSTALTISGWRDSKGAFRDVVRDTGRCSMGATSDWRRVPWKGVNRSTHALFTDGWQSVAVIRDGSYLVAVVVTDWDGGNRDLAHAKTAAQRVANRL